ncbi:hypothetical protein [Haloterrigena alkaliphila]|uniref:Uncharacterized protein n=1 Tax=Haloterrigena alkaliphila TaxID=2816475 RepID=A0A8A2VK52_9EURY|nr:hypothetical protein [Haloterrigena alkaliphila]QSX00998.1 hypothetical protein J0X25_08600 [Haloterrigena alkaliphila]
MSKNSGMIKYGLGNILFNAFPMYIFGSGILTALEFFQAVTVYRDAAYAVRVAANYYISKLTPFPLNEFLTAAGFSEVGLNVGLAVVIGAVVASIKWRRNV